MISLFIDISSCPQWCTPLWLRGRIRVVIVSVVRSNAKIVIYLRLQSQSCDIFVGLSVQVMDSHDLGRGRGGDVKPVLEKIGWVEGGGG